MSTNEKCGDCLGDAIGVVDDLCDKHFVALWEHRVNAIPRLMCGNGRDHEKVKWTDCPCSDVYRGRYERLREETK